MALGSVLSRVSFPRSPACGRTPAACPAQTLPSPDALQGPLRARGSGCGTLMQGLRAAAAAEASQVAGKMLALGRRQVPLLLEPALQLKDLSLREEHPGLPAAARLRPLAVLARLTVSRRFERLLQLAAFFGSVRSQPPLLAPWARCKSLEGLYGHSSEDRDPKLRGPRQPLVSSNRTISLPLLPRPPPLHQKTASLQPLPACRAPSVSAAPIPPASVLRGSASAVPDSKCL